MVSDGLESQTVKTELALVEVEEHYNVYII